MMKKTCEVEKRPQFTPFLLVPKNKLPISKTEFKKRKKFSEMLKKIISRNLAFTTSRANFKGNSMEISKYSIFILF